MDKLYNVLVVGGNGLVGRKLIEVLIKKNFPFKSIKGKLLWMKNFILSLG